MDKNVIISVRVSKELKMKMKKFSYVNWSEVVRKAIEERIAIEEKKEMRKKAAEEMDLLRNRLLESYGPTDYDSTEVIKLWRRLRK